MRSDTRTSATRRDRRKAKESTYRRLPKKAGRVSHGSGMTVGVVKGRETEVEERVYEEVVRGLTTLGDFWPNSGGEGSEEV